MLHRRQFLCQSAAITAAAALESTTARQAVAIPPIQRNGSPKFKFSLAAYSYRELLLPKQGKEPQLTLHDFIDDCAKMDLEGTELTSYYFPKEVSGDYLHGLRQHAFLLGLDISGTAIGNDFGHPKGEKRDAEIAKTKQWIEHAAVMDAPMIRIFAGKQQKDQTPAETHSLMVSAIEECCDYAGKFGVYLALENHGGPTSTAAGLLKFVQDVNSPWFGVNLDGGNFRETDDSYGELAQIAPFAVNAQIKAKVGRAPADFKRLAKIMRDANYRGYIVLEYEEPGNVREECPRVMNAIREAFA